MLDALEDGALTLTAIRLLAPHLTVDNCPELIAVARHKTKREVEVLVATLNPRPAVPTVIQKLPGTPPVTAPASRSSARATASFPPTSPTRGVATELEAGVVTAAPAPTPALTPLTPDRYRVHLTISRETHDKATDRIVLTLTSLASAVEGTATDPSGAIPTGAGVIQPVAR